MDAVKFVEARRRMLGGGVMENILQNIASGLWIVLGVYCFFGLRKWNKRASELYEELKREVE